MEPRMIELGKGGVRPAVEQLEERLAPAHVSVALPEAAFDAQHAAGKSPHLVLIKELIVHNRPGRVFEI